MRRYQISKKYNAFIYKAYIPKTKKRASCSLFRKELKLWLFNYANAPLAALTNAVKAALS